MDMINRQWILARRPQANIGPDDFEYREITFVPPILQDREILVRSRLFRFLPTMRTYMKGSQFRKPMPEGAPMQSPAAAEVIGSNNPDFPVGSIVSVMMGWQDYAVLDPSDHSDGFSAGFGMLKPEGMSLIDFEGLYGVNSLTAYFGLLEIGAPAAGETLLVSGAAGSTGSMVAQIGKLHGCRVIGIAGGRDKCDWLVDELGLDGAIDYKSEDVGARLGELCPRGVNIFFDNVGGAILDFAVDHMAPFGRIALCGQISSYDDGESLATGPRNMMRVIYWRLKMQGFVVSDYRNAFETAYADLRRWHEEGRVRHSSDIYEGFRLLPRTFMRLFDGTSKGTLLLRSD
jgi:NADPH-dependent curcumin reductase CurA